MDSAIEKSFEDIGARAHVSTESFGTGVSLDVTRGAVGEYFEIRRARSSRLVVLDKDPESRHLLLQVEGFGFNAPLSTFLCGHDERAWFVAAIPEKAGARTLQEAKDALKPPAVWEAIQEFGVPLEQRDQRRTAAFVRQGEWFFIPRPKLEVKQHLVLRREPIRRGAGKPHICQFLYRFDGEEVYVNDDFPNGLTLKQFCSLPRKMRFDRWERMFRGAQVFVRGSISHPDHETVSLREWHEVVQNTESEAEARRDVAFLD
jgi:hypothetical protein